MGRPKKEDLPTQPVGVDYDPWVTLLEAAVAFICQGNLKIIAQSGIIPLIPNQEQLQILNKVLEMARAGKPVRLIVCKARQVGISTIVAALFYVLTSISKGMRGLIAAHNRDGCDFLFRIYKFYLETDERKPETMYSNRREVLFQDTHSHLFVSVADRDLGRGGSIRLFHGSEYGFWREPEETLAVTFPMISDDHDSIVVLESTGEPNTDFELRFRTTLEKQEAFQAGKLDDDGELVDEPDFFAVFMPWFKQERYSIQLSPAEWKKVAGTNDEYEIELMGLGATPGNIKWFRKTLEQMNGNLEKFKSQYPATVDEAFAASMETFFDRRILETLVNGIREPLQTYEIILDEDQKTPVLIEDEEGRLRVHRPPIFGHTYVIGGDAAGESKHGVDDRLKSESALVVVDEIDGEIAAVWNGSVNAHMLGDIMAALGYYYNKAKLAPEANQHGHSTCHRIAHGLNYPNIYCAEGSDKVDITETDRLGWRQNETNRIIMLDVFQRLVHEFKVEIHDGPLVEQMRSFVKNQTSGKYKAKLNYKDDMVIACGIALAIASKGKIWGVKDRVALNKERRLMEPAKTRRLSNTIKPSDFGSLYKNPVSR